MCTCIGLPQHSEPHRMHTYIYVHTYGSKMQNTLESGSTQDSHSCAYVCSSAFFRGKYAQVSPQYPSLAPLVRSYVTTHVSTTTKWQRYAHALLNHWGLAVAWRLPQIQVQDWKYVHVHTHTPLLLKWLLLCVCAHVRICMFAYK